jgi:NAD(P)H-hydrate epimerase
LGRKVRVFHLVKGTDYKGATAENFKILQRMKAKLTHIVEAQEIEAYLAQAGSFDLAIDGIIGTGLKGDLEGHFYDVVGMMNRHFKEIVSLDIPTGVSGDSGQVQGIAIEASLTISFGFPRLGHFLPPGAGYRGKLVNVDISLPHRFSVEGDKFLLQAKSVAKKILRRDRYAHKNTFGHVLLVGGSPGRTGAIAMATAAALRTGAGLATAATWTDSAGDLISQLPMEAMTLSIAENEKTYEQYAERLKQFSAIVMGPGMGSRPGAKKLLEILLGYYPGPVVLDADALNLISEHGLHGLCQRRKAPTVLTPHPGEMARLLNWKKEQVVNDPIGALRRAVDLTHAVVLLKGAATLMLSPEETMSLNHFPNSGMATAGSGDVLAGMIGGLLAQGIPGFDAAQVGVYLHSLAGARAAKRVSPRGMMAGDIIRSIPGAYLELQRIYGEEETPRMAKLL